MTDHANVPSGRRRTLLYGLVAGLTLLGLAAAFVGGRVTVKAESLVPPSTTTSRVLQAAPVPRAGSYSDIVDKVAPAIVTIRVEGRAEPVAGSPLDPFREFFGRELPGEGGAGTRRVRGLGSGVLVRDDGRVLTNYHVVAGADRIYVDLEDGRTFEATVVGSDPPSDLALLKVPASELPTVPFGDVDAVRVGDVVLAFGNPLGIGQTVTMGIVSAKGRVTGVGDGSYEDFLQTDAPINQGNSGGALVNVRGELVGINAQIVSPTGGNIGIGFSIPSTMAKAVVEQLEHDGVVHRSKLGVTVQPLTADLAASLGAKDTHGALVSAVEPNSPAEQAGLRPGDIVTEVDGRMVVDANGLRNQVASMRPGSRAVLTVLRDGAPTALSASLVEREPSEGQAGHGSRGEWSRERSALGMALTPLTPEIAAQAAVPMDDGGLVVTDLDPDGVGAQAGLRPGDVIRQVNGKPVRTIAAVRSALAAGHGRPALVLLTRGDTNLFVALPAGGS